MPKLKMHDDRVQILPCEVKKNLISGSNPDLKNDLVEATAEGVIIPEVAKTQSKVLEGIIIDKGENVSLKKGARTLIMNGVGAKVPYGGKEYIILRESDILATIEKA